MQQATKILNNQFFQDILYDFQYDFCPFVAYLLKMIINPNCMRLLLIILIIISAFSFKQTILRNLHQPLTRLVDAHSKGQTSKAFSISQQVYLAVKTLHSDLQLTLQTPKDKVNCDFSLHKIAGIAASPLWVQRFHELIEEMGNLGSQCTNSDFKETQEEIQSGFQNQCALCVVILRAMQNYVNYHRVDVAQYVNKIFCNHFGTDLKPTCQAFIHYAGPLIITTLYNKQPSDKICLALRLCKDHSCRIVKQKQQEYGQLPHLIDTQKPFPWKWLIHLFVDHFGNGHLPVFDLDNDTFSDVSTFRGYNWRSSDCNQLDANTYPGRKDGSKLLDHDCNGIYGQDNLKRLYQDKFCAPYKRLGLAVLGDSAGAHFSIPQRFLNVTLMQKGTFDDLLPRLADQLDVPHESGYTGHTNTTYASRSLYKYMRDWNLCNNNDFQNIAVNGASSGNSWDNIQALKRTKADHPLLMVLELIGNDVCKKSFASMTKPEDFKKNILRILNDLDKRVPKGSHLMILGLGDGGLLYDNLHNQTHPLNVTYSNVYDFLNCLKISPCWGWLNSNQTVRNFTTQRAANLSKVYKQILEQTTFNNFDAAYYDFPSMQILERKAAQGGDPKKMIEPCDGFHPNVEFHSYLADWLWMKIRIDHPEWIGPRNPHNEEIRHVFGLQILK